jgi:hypothetical protein
MILHPRDQKTLDATASDLRAGDPRLAAMLAIFTRLTALDGKPPDEDLLTQAPTRPLLTEPDTDWPRRLRSRPLMTPAPPRVRRIARRPLWLAIVPIAMLVLLAVTVALGLASTLRCSPASSQPSEAGHARVPLACQPARSVSHSPSDYYPTAPATGK